MKVQDVLIDESKWTKYATARDSNNFITSSESEDAVRFCLLGAMVKVKTPLKQKLEVFRHILLSGYRSITHFNDTSSFDEVRGLVEELDL